MGPPPGHRLPEKLQGRPKAARGDPGGYKKCVQNRMAFCTHFSEARWPSCERIGGPRSTQRLLMDRPWNIRRAPRAPREAPGELRAAQGRHRRVQKVCTKSDGILYALFGGLVAFLRARLGPPRGSPGLN